MLGNRQINWDPNDKCQIDDAKTEYRRFKAEGQLIEGLDGVEWTHFLPLSGGFVIRGNELKENQFKWRILDDSGDRTMVWDSSDPAQVDEARATFESYLSKGWKAYAISDTGKRMRRIRRFNSELEEVEFDEGAALPFKAFVESFRRVQVLPKTYPG